MQSRSLRRWSKPVLHAGVAALLVSTSAMADDTEVFTAQIAASAKPNLLFVLDYSGSMADPVPGPSTDKKIDVLKTAVRQLMLENKDKINAGIGSLYGTTPSGVQWPISDLEADANTIDPRIPAGTRTVRDIISMQLDSRKVEGWTSTVDALAEAASYFRGDSVYHNGRSANEPAYHIPDFYIPTDPPMINGHNGSYYNGHKDAAISSSYTPSDAYSTTGGTTSYGYCRDYSYGGEESGTNWCAGKAQYDCDTIYPNSGSSGDNGTWSSDKHYKCKYPRADRWAGATYKSPIVSECQVNAIILVSDGEPTRRSNESQIKDILGSTDLDADCKSLATMFGGANTEGAKTGRCGAEILSELSRKPQVDGITDSTVRTFTVGFATDGPGEKYLTDLAVAGNGDFFEASDPATLTKALKSILGELLTTSQSFAPLAVDVDRANFSHEDRLYYSMFKPTGKSSWGGNLKGYFLGDDELMDINDNPATEVKNGVRLMRRDAQSFWSRTPDGDDVIAGGASALFDSGNRTLYTYTGDSAISNLGVELNDNGTHNLRESNDLVTDAMLGGTGNRDTLLEWIQTAPMGDPLHSQPVQIKYDNGPGAQNVMYVMTNQGFLHAIDATTPKDPDGTSSGGEEIFAFMPQELLSKIPSHYENAYGDDHIYGLDGALIRWHNDGNKNGIVDENDDVTLVFGMRRGGTHYYAVDVTRPSTPKLKWRIDGGSTEFPGLGETWSRPALINVLINNVEQKVLAFGGGYDAATLDGSTQPTASTGNAIYMVDSTGAKVFSVEGSAIADMDYAIPSDLTVLDTNGDEITDRIYVGDLGGQIWRVDFDNINLGPRSVKKLADLNDGGHRSFFYPPSVALNSSVYGDFLSVSIGSGNRTNPLRADSMDRMYMIRDTHVTDPLPNGYIPVTTGGLYDASANDIGAANKVTAAQARTDLNGANGWYIDLAPHEKSLSPLVTFEGKILATTFDADDSNIDPCEAQGNNRFYLMDVSTAQPVPAVGDPAGTTTYLAEDRYTSVEGDGILPNPEVLFTKKGISIIVDNTVMAKLGDEISRIFWVQQ